MSSRTRTRAVLAGSSVALLGGLILTAGHPASSAKEIVGADRLARLAAISDRHAHAHVHSRRTADESRIEGEFGLWARFDGDSLRVSWITRQMTPGFLEVTAASDGGERVAAEAAAATKGAGSEAPPVQPTAAFETPPGLSHTVSFPLPREESVVLSYGSREDAEGRHRTRLWLHSAETPPDAAPVRIEGVDSLFVIGDIHGEYDNMVRVLRNAGLIDTALDWSGGRSHLVVLGDMMSRGQHATGVLWFLYRLERQARAAGGRVHIVLGNHELMVMVDDLRYVRPKERQIAELHGIGYARMYDPRHSVLGRWLVSKPGAIQVDDVLLAHGGVSGDYQDVPLESHRDTLAAYLSEDLFYHWTDTTVVIPMDSLAFERRFDFFWGDRSVFWYRGYAQSDTLGNELDSVLRGHGSRLHVVAHTPVPSIREAYGGRLVLVNTIDFASELLLLVRGEDGYERLRFRIRGPPEPL